jgi:hypothetical protein
VRQKSARAAAFPLTAYLSIFVSLDWSKLFALQPEILLRSLLSVPGEIIKGTPFLTIAVEAPLEFEDLRTHC